MTALTQQEPSEALKTKTSRLKEKIEKLKEEMQCAILGLEAPKERDSYSGPDWPAAEVIE